MDIGAYDLMPNHYHFLLRERHDGGITSFMRKVGTAYTMYFNIKYGRTGALYEGAFKAKHVRTDGYFGRLLNYIHGNHAALSEPGWKAGKIKNETRLIRELTAYPYSSFTDYYGETRIESSIIDKNAVFEVIDKMSTIANIIQEARTFARQHDDELFPERKMAR